MDRQKIYNQVKEHLLKQGRPALRCDLRGVYRSTNGDKCAIGCLIPDWLYCHEMEGLSAKTILHNYIELAEYLNYREVNDAEFIEQLQRIHDGWVFGGLEILKEKFDVFANRFGLQP